MKEQCWPLKRFLSVVLLFLALACQSFFLLDLSSPVRNALVLEGMLLGCLGLATYARTCQRHRLWGLLGFVPMAGIPLAITSLMLLDWFERQGRLETAPKYVQFANTVLRV